MFKNKTEFKKEFTRRLVESYGCTVEETHITEKYVALAKMVRDYANVNWRDTKVAAKQADAREIYYFSIEFLIGRMLTSNLKNLGIYDMVVEGLDELGIDYHELSEYELDPGLGNGGLGRLAACFMDSGASLNYPLNGNCIRYKSGLFKQYIDHDGNQVEVPDYWLKYGNPWEIRKPKHSVEVNFYGQIETSYDAQGNMHFQHVNPIRIVAVPYDMAIIGAGTKTTNTLRLWSAEPSEESGTANTRDYLSLVDDITEKLYPDDSTDEGKYLRLMQEYFFVSAGINSIVRSHLKQYPSLKNLGKKVAIQMNDTHPVLVIPELLRVLMDEYEFSWDDAWAIVKETVSYTNHTVMSEALEKWPVPIISNLLPRIYMIIQETDRRFIQWVSERCGNDHEMIQRMKIIKDNQVHMANLAVIGSNHVNGVAEIHTEILKNDLFRDFYHIFPEKFTNKTNGITPRRWMLYSNPELKELLDKKIGKSYASNYKDFEKLMAYVDSKSTQNEFLKVKRQRKEILAAYINRTCGVAVDPDSIFDAQAKRLHAYKRQLLNIMQIIYRYERIKEDPNYWMPKHTYIFAAKAASSYTFAKKVIKLINNVANVINNDPDVKDMIKVVFLPNYNVSMAEVLVPGTDVSEQISTAGKEASGTGCMKFMMNGAVTIGTMDGANVEIDRLVGRDNDVIFGLSVDDINRIKYSYNAREYYEKDVRIRKVMDTFTDAVWSQDPDDFRLIFNELMTKNDEFFVLADFDAYVKAQEKIEELYQDPHQWARMCLVNIAKSGYFSSDRTIEQYTKDIWKVKKLEV
ncbi:MAG: glycogen/starch/alpha-glucan phosphorylase [Solobacterium sp.]|jgi:starch phosphorylase|nr:glycogen/starch/alpha-glucan phosphorylase [Solobacterium sp.]MCH4204759.1 glycogen/starch/alpha-glucan phosphorylase [Solobacterium sp.]MCH4226383.1 glycogen/starch/alpha-glucan phosphorylase [Solobacterium sp.]MCH4282373.1 glycogen/starch/alpha-glucan phosphorylase [Solobacterium sp.]